MYFSKFLNSLYREENKAGFDIIVTT